MHLWNHYNYKETWNEIDGKAAEDVIHKTTTMMTGIDLEKTF